MSLLPPQVSETARLLFGQSFWIFCTHLGLDIKQLFTNMENLCQKNPFSLFELALKEVVGDQYMQKVKEFLKNLKEEIKK